LGKAANKEIIFTFRHRPTEFEFENQFRYKKPTTSVGFLYLAEREGFISGSCPRRYAVPSAIQIVPDDLSNHGSHLLTLT
jgi:hypothetical protein